MKIDFANLTYQYSLYQEEIDTAIRRVLAHGKFIMGPEVEELEKGLCRFTEAAHAVTCSSGTDALLLALMALDIGPGDEVITTPFTFIATAETVALLGAKPVFVDIDAATCNIDASKIEAAVNERTRAVLPVSLYGQPADLEKIGEIARKYDLRIIVDGAQSFGATYEEKAEVHRCDIFTTSFFPAKPLGCFGDGGAVLTNDSSLAEKMRMLRIHGQRRRYRHERIGLGARLDTLQAAVLNVKLKHYPEDLQRRGEVARTYTRLFEERGKKSGLPLVKGRRTSAWAQYSLQIENREEVAERLKNDGIPTAVHYPVPLHLQECFAYLGHRQGAFPVAESVSEKILSLPMNPYLKHEEMIWVVERFLEACSKS